MNKAITKCPICGGEVVITRVHCPDCDTTFEGQFLPEHNPFGQLTPEQAQFILTFVRCEGRFNRMEDELKLSYPTLRSRFNEILRVMGYEPAKDEQLPPRVTVDDRRKILEDLDEGRISWAEAQLRLKGKKTVAVEDEAPAPGADES